MKHLVFLEDVMVYGKETSNHKWSHGLSNHKWSHGLLPLCGQADRKIGTPVETNNTIKQMVWTEFFSFAKIWCKLYFGSRQTWRKDKRKNTTTGSEEMFSLQTITNHLLYGFICSPQFKSTVPAKHANEKSKSRRRNRRGALASRTNRKNGSRSRCTQAGVSECTCLYLWVMKWWDGTQCRGGDVIRV